MTKKLKTIECAAKLRGNGMGGRGCRDMDLEVTSDSGKKKKLQQPLIHSSLLKN